MTWRQVVEYDGSYGGCFPRAKDSCVDLPFYTHDAAGLLSSESVNDEGVIEISDGRHVTKQADGEEVGIGWLVTYRRGDAPKIGIPERSVFTVVDGRIAAGCSHMAQTLMALMFDQVTHRLFTMSQHP